MRPALRPALRPVLFLALLLALLSCTRDPGQARTLRFMFWGDPAEVRTIRKLIARFETEHPELAVELVHQPSGQYRDNLRTRINGGDAPDLMYMGLEDYAGFARNGQLLALDELIAADKDFDPKAFFPELYREFCLDGKRYGIAKDFATLVLYFNKDLFDKWDVPYPKDDWTWDDFLETAKKLTHKGATPQETDYGVVLETWVGQWLPWVWQNGGQVVDEERGEWLLGDPSYLDQNAAALQFLCDLIWKHEVAPNPSYTRDAGTSDVFKSGRAAMYTAGRWMCMQFKDIDSFDWEVTTLPRGKSAATTLFTAALAISTQSKYPKDAFTLMKFLLSAESQSTLANAGLAIPVRQDVAAAPAFMKPSAFPPGLAIDHGANIRCVPDARVPPHSAIWPELRQRVADRLDRVFTNQETAREALIALQRPLEKLLKDQAEKH